jgi:hypothetical protein
VSEIERASREIQPRPRHLPATRPGVHRGGQGRDVGEDARDEHGADEDWYEEPGADWSRQLATLRRHQVTLASLALIVISLLWKVAFLAHYYFRQDDFQVLDAARKSSLSWGFVTHVDAGHFFPGVYALAWVLSRTALYNWTVAAGVVLVFTAAASLAAWRMLRTMLGNRPAILIPLALYLFSPLAFPLYTWWITAAEAIPLQIALFMAVDAHLRYVWTGKMRLAIAAAGWLVFGLIFFEKSAVIPPLLFAITAAFLARRKRLLSAVWATLTELWQAWLLYFGVLAAYLAVFFVSLRRAAIGPKAPASAHAVGTFGWDLLFRTFVPGSLGGPWRWLHMAGASGAFSRPPVIVAWLALLLALAVIAASVLTRRRTWRGWVILLGWIAVADVLPVAIGRLATPVWAPILATEPRYVADATCVLVIVIGLTFWPLAGPREEGENRQTRRTFFGGRWRTTAIALVTVFAIGSVWSVSEFLADTTSVTGAYIANATKALAGAPDGSAILDQQVPSDVMIGAFKQYADTSVVLGPLVPHGKQVRWVGQPSGNVSRLLIFGPDGQLYKAAISGVTTTATSVFEYCLTSKRSRLVVHLPAMSRLLAAYTRVLRVGYLADGAFVGGTMTVTYGSHAQQLAILAGGNNAYFPVVGGANEVTFQIQGQAAAGGFCVEKAVAGYYVPLPRTGIPAVPAT